MRKHAGKAEIIGDAQPPFADVLTMHVQEERCIKGVRHVEKISLGHCRLQLGLGLRIDMRFYFRHFLAVDAPIASSAPARLGSCSRRRWSIPILFLGAVLAGTAAIHSESSAACTARALLKEPLTFFCNADVLGKLPLGDAALGLSTLWFCHGDSFTPDTETLMIEKARSEG